MEKHDVNIPVMRKTDLVWKKVEEMVKYIYIIKKTQKQVRADVTTVGTALVEDNMHNGSRTHGASSNIYRPPTTSYLASKSSEPTF